MRRFVKCMGLVIFWTVLCVAVASGWETTDAQVDWISQPSMRLETPHTKWANPYAGGTLRVLYFLGSDFQGMGTRGREIIELMQRFDLRVDIAYNYNFYRPHWFGGWVGNRRIARLLKTNVYDVFVFQDISPADLPEQDDVRRDFIAAVRDGAGVVLSGAEDGGVMGELNELLDVPGYLDGVPVEAVFEAGKGRIVKLPARPIIPFDVGWQVEYEYWQEQFGRSMLWAANRIPDMKLAVSTVEERFERNEVPPDAVALQYADTPDGGVYGVVNLRRGSDGERVELFAGDLEGNGERRLSLPPLKAGRYHLDAIATGHDGVESWSTASFEVTVQASVAIDLEWDRREHVAEWARWNTPWGEIGEQITGGIQAELQSGQTLELRLMDHAGRILRVLKYPRGNAHTFGIDIEAWMPQLLRLEAVIREGDSDVASDYEWFVITQRQQGRFHFVLWGFPDNQTLSPYAAEQLRDMGVTCILSHRPPDLAAAAYGFTWASFTGGQVGNPENWQNLDPQKGDYFQLQTGRDRPHGVLTYSLGDEGRVTGAGIGPKPMEAYRQYLRGIYDDIQSLNASWETDFGEFTEVVLSAPDETNEQAALEAGHYARWYDRQMFHRYNFVQHGKDHRAAMRNVDPKALMGFEGSGNFARSGDPDLICRELDMWVPYAGSIDEVIRSIARPEFIRSTWMGYHWTADGLLAEYWRPIVYGANSIWWWMWSTLDPWRGFHAPDLRGFPATEEMLEDTKVIREGLGDLLMNSRMLDDGIAMLYSMPSSFAVTLRNMETYGDYEPYHVSWYTIIHDMPMQFRYVTDNMMDLGEFDADEFKVLILPAAVAISDETAAVIRRFVEKGGTVVADIRPGVFNGRCKPLACGVLDDVFGIEGPVDTPAVRRAIAVVGAIGELDVKLSWKRVPIDPSLRTTTGRALGSAGDAPVFIVNEYGAGRAILLNIATSVFGGRRLARGLTGQGSAEELDVSLWRAFKPIFESAGATPSISIQQLRRDEPPYMGNVRIQRWRNGEMQIVSLFREVQTGHTAQGAAIGVVSLAGGEGHSHVYDLRHQLTVGETRTLFADIIPSRASFFALLPGPAPKVHAVFAQPELTRGNRAVLSVSLPDAGESIHAVKLRGYYPDGSEIKSWETIMMVGKAGQTIHFPVAMNDPAGTYTVTATDVITPETAAEVLLVVK